MKASVRRGKAEAMARHLDAVAGLCAELAHRNGVDPRRAAVAGAMHDLLKPVSSRRLAAILRDCRGKLDAATRRSPALWHGPAASALARAGGGMKDGEILEAVRWHTTGHPAGSRLGNLLFVADFCEANRDFREAAVGRKAALKDLNLGVRYVIASKLAYLLASGIVPHPAALAFWKSMYGRMVHG